MMTKTGTSSSTTSALPLDSTCGAYLQKPRPLLSKKRGLCGRFAVTYEVGLYPAHVGSISILFTHNGEENPFNKLFREIRSGERNYSLHHPMDDAIADGLSSPSASVPIRPVSGHGRPRRHGGPVSSRTMATGSTRNCSAPSTVQRCLSDHDHNG